MMIGAGLLIAWRFPACQNMLETSDSVEIGGACEEGQQDCTFVSQSGETRKAFAG